MNLLDPRAPFVFASIAFLGIVGFLTIRHPSPGDLTGTHAVAAGEDGLDTCSSCHAKGGLAAGCLECHGEIREQIAKGSGYHGFILAGKEAECRVCHMEHQGRDFPLVNLLAWGDDGPAGFRHPHVAFTLEGKHAGLACEACHPRTRTRPSGAPAPVPSAAAGPTYLGASQECIACHEDIHSGGLSRDCASCHDQDRFRPASGFDHSRFFPLDGGHERVACGKCHVIPEQGVAKDLPFHVVRGKRCEECHATPHRTPWGGACENCHPREEPKWSAGRERLTPALHAIAGFRLEAPHATVACDRCHPPAGAYSSRFPDPAVAGYARKEDSCEGCHEDVHGGQFVNRHSQCVACHDARHFLPVRLGIRDHTIFPLDGPHIAVPCAACHPPRDGGRPREFVGVERRCKGCHEDPHGGQFTRELAAGDCDACHAPRGPSFRIQDYDHAARTGYALEGGHEKASCTQCHVPRESAGTAAGAPPVVLWRGRSRECASCHADPHAGQFRTGNRRTDCTGCHGSFASWKGVKFDHDRQSRFPLDGVHSKLDCALCHPTVPRPGGGSLVQYKPLGTECKDCHAVKTR